MQTPVKQPIDAAGYPITSRSMGLPIVQDSVTLCDATNFVDIFDLSLAAYQTRVFTSVAIQNPSQTSTIQLAFGQSFASVKSVVCGTSQFFVIDNLMFGPAVLDDTTQSNVLKVRARLGTAQGVQATGTITVGGNPSDKSSLLINGIVYEFANDLSWSIPNSVQVSIAATANLTWANLNTKINANEQAVRSSLVGGVLTLTSVAGGAAANAITIADGGIATGASFSGATLSGATGGLTPVFHIW